MEIHKGYPVHSAPAMKLLKTYVETGSFGSDTVELREERPQECEADQETLAQKLLLKTLYLQLDAVTLGRADGSSEDLAPEKDILYTKTGLYVENKLHASGDFVACIPRADSKIYLALGSQENVSRIAYAEESTLEFGGPPTKFFGFTSFKDGPGIGHTLNSCAELLLRG